MTMNELLEQMTVLIDKYNEYVQHDAFNEGYDEAMQNSEILIDEARDEAYDEAWDEARNKGYDEGWEDACQYIMDNLIERTGFVVTPISKPDCQDRIEHHQDNGALCVMMYMNWLSAVIQDMKNGTS